VDEKILLRMPFGASMREAFHKRDAKGNYIHQKHLTQIVHDMNVLLSGDPRNIISNRNEPEADFAVAKWVVAWKEIHKKQLPDTDEKPMWRLEAFLHDVGKSLTYSKHPTRGQYLITRLKPIERELMVRMIGSDRFAQLEKVIGFHDRFGVISTGEASFGVLADTIDMGEHDTHGEHGARILSHIMVLNLIDIGASVPWGLISQKVGVVLEDWMSACWADDSPLRESQGDRGVFERKLIELSARDDLTIDRVSRLLSEAYRRARYEASQEHGFDEPRWPAADSMDFARSARRAMDTVIIPRDWQTFKLDLAHVVKMDYLLYFLDRVVKVHWGKHASQDRLAVCIVEVVQMLVRQFADLIRTDGGRSRIGIDLSVLRDTPEVRNQIADLLTGDQADAAYGLEWLIHETGAWPF
jgi:hypothetical protein